MIGTVYYMLTLTIPCIDGDHTFVLLIINLVCDAMCAGGQGGCTTVTDCCPFYDVVTRMCITACPAGSINTTDYTCGTYTIMFV